MKKIPRRVKIDSQWYDVSTGWAGSLELRAFDSPSFKANEPFVHITNLYHVFDSNGSKVGEFSIDNRSYSGRVTGFEV
ncbi:MAG: hypothetical protein LBU89_11675 [Fibromonadaceae bacterium]|jgi:hypothetical protein|nr:hypothetical protein [Fibromonadaceae bacterium]